MSVVKRQKIGNDHGIVKATNGKPKGRKLYSPSIYLEGGHEGTVSTGKFNKNGSYLATGGFDKFINIWKLPTDEEEQCNVWCSQAHKNAVTCVRWINDDNLVSSSADLTLAFWDCETGDKVRNCKNSSIINEIDTFESMVVSGDDDGMVKLWDPRQKSPLSTISNKFPILTCTFNHKGTNLYFSGIDPTINTFDLRKLDTPLWKCQGPIDSITSISLNSDDSMLVSRSTRGVVNVYNSKDFLPESVSRISPYSFEGAPADNEYKLIRSCFSNDNINIISGSDDKTVTMWNVSSRRMANKLAGHEGSVLDVDFHPTEKILLSTAVDGSIIVREL